MKNKNKKKERFQIFFVDKRDIFITIKTPEYYKYWDDCLSYYSFLSDTWNRFCAWLSRTIFCSGVRTGIARLLRIRVIILSRISIIINVKPIAERKISKRWMYDCKIRKKTKPSAQKNPYRIKMIRRPGCNIKLPLIPKKWRRKSFKQRINIKENSRPKALAA